MRGCLGPALGTLLAAACKWGMCVCPNMNPCLDDIISHLARLARGERPQGQRSLIFAALGCAHCAAQGVARGTPRLLVSLPLRAYRRHRRNHIIIWHYMTWPLHDGHFIFCCSFGSEVRGRAGQSQ